jgi:hypothetical protein
MNAAKNPVPFSFLADFLGMQRGCDQRRMGFKRNAESPGATLQTRSQETGMEEIK